MAQLCLRLTPEACQHFDQFLSGVTEYEPTLCLMKSDATPAEPARWYCGAYAPSNIQAVEPGLAALGYPLLHHLQGRVVAIPQAWLLQELEGKTLTSLNGHLVLQEDE
jgi:hypothetical protein